MQEYELSVLDQYNIEVISTRKTRGAVLCETSKGVLLLKAVTAPEKRIPVLCELYGYMDSKGYGYSDRILLNKEESCVSTAQDGGKYILKQWFEGRECDIRKPGELLAAAGNLAKLHIIMRGEMDNNVTPGTHMKEEYMRHNRELKKVRRFMRELSPKGEFEFEFLKSFDQMYQWADIALGELERSGYDALYHDSIEKSFMTHGEYNYHNVLVLYGEPGREANRIATTNFDKFKKDVQVEDLYYFLRKVMEKHGWKERLGDNMLNAYSAIRPLGREEMEYIKNRLIYPEKFWKIANSYYHSNKAWISVKSIEKLGIAIKQTEEKQRFLENIFSFHL